jgi:hypothetical protein
MEKIRLQNRLNEIEKLIADKNKSIQQGMADLNVLLGCKNECLHWMKEMDTPPLTLDELKNVLGADKIEVMDNK